MTKDSREHNAKDHREKRLNLYSPSKKFSEAKRAVKRRLNEIRYTENSSHAEGSGSNTDFRSKLEPTDNFDSRMTNNSQAHYYGNSKMESVMR